jgi:hypothetical protein
MGRDFEALEGEWTMACGSLLNKYSIFSKRSHVYTSK